MTVNIEPIEAGRTQMLIVSTFHSREALELALTIDMAKGLTSAIGQIEAILAESPGSKRQ